LQIGQAFIADGEKGGCLIEREGRGFGILLNLFNIKSLFRGIDKYFRIINIYHPNFRQHPNIKAVS